MELMQVQISLFEVHQLPPRQSSSRGHATEQPVLQVSTQSTMQLGHLKMHVDSTRERGLLRNVEAGIILMPHAHVSP